jgi:4-alpha-glucanotransferase
MNLRRSGVLLHISSLPGPHGIGDFGPDAYRFVDWLEAAGQRVWQLLPLTPIGPGDSPYQSVSAFAGSPLMVALEPLLAKGWLADVDLPALPFEARRADYGRIVPWRDAHLRRAAAGFEAQADAADLAAFHAWCAAQAHWLEDYALFMALEKAHRARGGEGGWWAWDTPLATRDGAALVAARQQHVAEIAFQKFVQWCFDTQWLEVKAYANRKGIELMGDLPIFVAHHSADCWARPDLYFLDERGQPTVVAGVPPDFFSATGQRWGNPLYHWNRMAADGYRWWLDRIRRALEQADIFRIDHFRGFAAYWEIPASCPTAIEGSWVPGPGADFFAAVEQALGRLPIVAEDLGIITPDVDALRESFRLPGMRILQFAFGDDARNAYLPHRYVPGTVVYTGTHDNDTTLGWWHTASEREQAFVRAYLGIDALAAGTAPAGGATAGPGVPAPAAPATLPEVPWALMRAASTSVADLALFPLQDVLGLDGSHRMNTPGTMGGNWAWRFDWSMVPAEAGTVLARMTAASGRCEMAGRL